MKIAYLINQYPEISHSFIRREILALESIGIPIARFSIRYTSEKLVDPADQAELEKTYTVLAHGLLPLLFSLIWVGVTRPLRWLEAAKLTCQMGWRSERGLWRHWAYLAEACQLLGKFSALGISHVHAHFGTNSTTVALLCRVLGGPSYSFTVHGPEEFDKPQAIALPEKIKRATFVVAISAFGKSQLYRWCDASHWSKIHVVHCGVDQSFFSAPFQPIPESPRLVCVARLSEQKGQLLLIQAVAQLVRQGIALKLVLVGDGPMRSDLETLIAEFGLGEVVELAGWASGAEVQQQILSSRALVLPSFAEGLPVVIMESLALRRPIISTYIAGIPELVESGVCGWLTPAGSIDDLATAMRSALQLHPHELEQMGKAGAERVAQQHDVIQEAKKLAMLFQKYAPEGN